MPTPDDESAALRSPPDESSSSRASFASCPPEEEREAHPPREARAAIVAFPDEQDTTLRAAASERVGEQPPLSEPGAGKGDHIEESGTIAADSPSPEPVSDTEARSPAQARATATSRPSHNGQEPRYLKYPTISGHNLHSNSTTSFLKPGSKFRGTQQSDRQVYDVQVEIKDVDLAASFICGYLRIQGLTDDHPTLTTFFEGEIIGPKYLFRTSHPSWNSSEKIDLQHWARFPAWRPLARAAKNNPSFTLKNYLEREHLFMRWKEYFLVPDHRVKSISGASFEGFYYICFDQRAGSVSGIYFHAKSEKYQQLELRHVHDGGRVGAVEFR